ncbi:MAG: DUF86 domain-containing protein [Candidatus Uhrbacteria bacterium]|nr:DUF86 domain-containing protein [Candidatus Uhrbacteria bacterium]
MINKNIIEGKLTDIQRYFGELEPVLKFSCTEILDDPLKIHTVERLFQLIVDTAVDINTHIIVESAFGVPDDYQNTFVVLGEQKILPMSFVNRIAPSVGLRNMIIHRYGHVDLKRMVDDIASEIGDYREYVKYILDFLKKV